MDILTWVPDSPVTVGTTTPIDGASLADMRRLISDLNAIEGEYREALRAMAEAGATAERICAAAIDQCIRRSPRRPTPDYNPNPGALRLGATASDLGRAAVEALRITGHLPTAEKGNPMTIEGPDVQP
jgi:hypothetical protein